MKISPAALPVSLAEHIQILKRCVLSVIIGALVTLIHMTRVYWTVQSGLCQICKCYESDKNSRFYEASCRFNILCNGEFFDPFSIDIQYHRSCYLKCAINSTGKSDKNHFENERNLIKHYGCASLEKWKVSFFFSIITNYKAIKNKSNKTRQYRTQNLHKTYTA